jgi:hypothetical protein
VNRLRVALTELVDAVDHQAVATPGRLCQELVAAYEQATALLSADSYNSAREELNHECNELVRSIAEDDQDGKYAVLVRLKQSLAEMANGDVRDINDVVREAMSDDQIDEIWDEEAGYFNLYDEARRFARRIREL